MHRINTESVFFKSIQSEARVFAQRYLSSQGVLDYIYAILQEYIKIQVHQPKIRDNSHPVSALWSQSFRDNYCRVTHLS